MSDGLKPVRECVTCQWWKPSVPGAPLAQNLDGRCTRYAPKGEDWPRTWRDDTCGDWTERR